MRHQINYINMKKKIGSKRKLELNKLTVLELNNMKTLVGGKEGPQTPDSFTCTPGGSDDRQI